ncbi:DUF4911 domain-containing protein [Polyangium jinanense]|uniref:DUF4911 domain-containing protein n=1 Tax=Polyangium jinanense TaxID=2829994 RepID=A0A9X3X4B2_9BACT|nr:DUF4911 domain-containing protein [Polyangium jinanense]MDC3955633.1 DUF4911 domain-containing protein [Polyangium jinanense]MDC3982275.1 DUF4911 domain-containing protein [Polyangium jinanense]
MPPSDTAHHADGACTPHADQAPSSARSPGHGGPARRRRALPIPEVSAGMLVRRVDVRPADVVFLKGILEASEGLGTIFAERGGELFVAAPPDREKDLVELLDDLVREIDVRVHPEAQAGSDR